MKLTDKLPLPDSMRLMTKLEHSVKFGNQANTRVFQLLVSARTTFPLLTLIIGVLITILGVTSQLFHFVSPLTSSILILLGSLLIFFSLILVLYRFSNQVLFPLVDLSDALADVQHGDDVKLTVKDAGALGTMVEDIGSINEELTNLYEDMDDRVSGHTRRLAQKTASLKILYEVAGSVANIEDIDELLIRYLRILKEMLNGRAATIRLLLPKGKIRLLGSIGLNNDILRENQMFPVQLCLCGTALAPGDILCQNNVKHCSRRHGREMFDSEQIESISVPLEYHGEALGIYNIFVDRTGLSEREDLIQLLTTIGAHLGAAIAKNRSDAQARMLSISNERTSMAHELHDSLAQTLASLRFQIRMLEDSLVKEEADTNAMKDVSRISNGIDEAHIELRELINNFRAPIGEKGLLPALEKLMKRYEREAGISVFLHNRCTNIDLSANEDMQILRIVQEALANIRKHAKAQHVRVLLSCRDKKEYSLLIEDDGVGFDNQLREGNPGEHIGLSIMQERAQRLGGMLRIESEVGEGTRVELLYSPDSQYSLTGEASE